MMKLLIHLLLHMSFLWVAAFNMSGKTWQKDW